MLNEGRGTASAPLAVCTPSVQAAAWHRAPLLHARGPSCPQHHPALESAAPPTGAEGRERYEKSSSSMSGANCSSCSSGLAGCRAPCWPPPPPPPPKLARYTRVLRGAAEKGRRMGAKCNTLCRWKASRAVAAAHLWPPVSHARLLHLTPQACHLTPAAPPRPSPPSHHAHAAPSKASRPVPPTAGS